MIQATIGKDILHMYTVCLHSHSLPLMQHKIPYYAWSIFVIPHSISSMVLAFAVSRQHSNLVFDAYIVNNVSLVITQ